MTVYLVSCALSVLTMNFGLKMGENRRSDVAIVFFSALPLIAVSALRYNVGTDYLYTYRPYFEAMQKGILTPLEKMEPLYYYLNVAVSSLHGDFFGVCLICAILFFVPVYAHILRTSPIPCLSVFLLMGMGFVFVSFNAMRQMVGCALLLYSLRFVQERRLWPFVLLVLLASGFHYSCLLFFPVFFLERLTIRPKLAWLLTGGFVVFGSLVTRLALFLIRNTKYGVYIASEFDTGRTAWVMLAINIVILLLMSVTFEDEESYRMYYNLQMLSVWITMFSGRIVLFLRILWMFGMCSVIALPMAMVRIPEKKTRTLAIGATVLLYLLYFFYTVGLQNSNGVLPYQTVFQEWLA